jgi:hypothetical protein
MKSSPIWQFIFLIFLLLSLETGIVLSKPLQYSARDTIAGIWAGELEIPNSAFLRMGIVISKTGNNSYKAVLNIIDQATGDIPCDEVIYKNDSIIIRIKGLGLEIAGILVPENKIIKSEFKQHGGILPVSFTRTDKLPELLRPQEPKEPFPYVEENVIFENKKAGIRLAGTLTFPNSKEKFPAVILVTGSGQQDRNENIGGHKPFWIIADYLTRNGIAVLRVDDRGIGGSTGNFSQSTTGDFAEDALAGITFLKSRPEIDPKKIGIMGHSEGGIVAPLAASISSDVAFVVSMAGVIINFEDVIIDQIQNQQKQVGRNDEDLELERNWRKKIYSLAKENTDSLTAAKKLWNLYGSLTEDQIKRLNWPRGRHEAQIKQVLNPWWRYVLALDNKAVLMKVKCPVLATYGELDQQVNPDKNIQMIEEVRSAGSNKNITVKKFPGLNHLFQTAKTGSEYEYIRIEETFSPLVLQFITDWILKQIK